MTLRVEVSIVPFGDEVNKYEISRLDISNTGVVKDLGFGHKICSYNVKVFSCFNEDERRALDYPKHVLENEFVIPEHDRRDGALELVKKALNELKP